ncbi:MAG: family ATPase, subfamily [Herbinix sp.]|nr:family ATPase, subfamily [Herbinix sp.]
MENQKPPIYKVAEALSKDVGKSIARMEQKDILRMGAVIGDIIEIKGKTSALARAMPLYEEFKGKNIIQMDGILRRNAGVGIDENVEVKLIPVEDASSIVICCTSNQVESEEDIKYLKNILEGTAVFKGNYLRVKSIGYASSEYIVADTKPEGAVRITKDTTIKFKNEGMSKSDNRVTYEDIGGLEKQIQRIREMIELPLKYPEIFQRLGIDAPKGLLLFGPPGTGKTLIARAVANETDAYFIHVNGPEIINKFYGESEARLREIFDTASKNAPSIIFLDEIDAISPKRESVNGDVEKRVVAQLLALMDGLKDRGQVIVIGATNLPNAIDSALRRPGRFDREIEIGIPDQRGRLQILQVFTRDMPLNDNIDLERLAELTHGYVGADLQSLCREAAMSALRKFFPQINFSTAKIPYEIIRKLTVTMEDFYNSLHEIEPSAIREVFVEIPNVSFQDIGGLDDVKDIIIKSIIWPEQYKDAYEYFGCKAPRGILFYGEPGTGKTLFAKAIASLNNTNFISVKGPELLSKWVGDSEKGLRDIFKKAKQAAPCIIFFDEIDALVPVRGRNNDNNTTERMICQMLTEMDGIEELHGVTVIGATNRLDIVDPALLRPGRFDLLLEFKAPDLAGRLEIFKIYLKGKPLAEDVELNSLAEITQGYTGADIMEICQRASLDALSEYINDMQNIQNMQRKTDDKKDKKIHYRNFQKVVEMGD